VDTILLYAVYVGLGLLAWLILVGLVVNGGGIAYGVGRNFGRLFVASMCFAAGVLFGVLGVYYFVGFGV